MADLVLYGSPVSPFVRKVQAVLHKLEVAYEFENVNILAMPDWFVEISPVRRIPVLRDKTIGTEGVAGTIPDSTAICLYLQKRFDAALYGHEPYACGRAAWYEEYADTVLASTVGMGLFRPIMFPLFRGQPSDLETASKTWTEKLPEMFDYLEASLNGNAYFVGEAPTVADFAIAAQMTQIDMVAGLPDKLKWPALVRHTEAMKAEPGFAENLTTCSGMLGRLLPEKVKL